MKNNIDLSNPPVFEFSQPINNTSKHSNNIKNHSRHHSTFDIFNINNLNYNNIKDVNQPILYTNLNNSIYNKENNNNSNYNNKESFVTNNDSSHLEINQENEFKMKRKNRNKFHSEIKNNNEIFKKNNFNLEKNIDNFPNPYDNYNQNKKFKENIKDSNFNVSGNAKDKSHPKNSNNKINLHEENTWRKSSLGNIDQNNYEQNLSNRELSERVTYTNNYIKDLLYCNNNIKEEYSKIKTNQIKYNNTNDLNENNKKTHYINNTNINEANSKDEKCKNLNESNFKRKSSSKIIDEKGIFDSKKEVVYKNNLLISEDSIQLNKTNNINNLNSREFIKNNNNLSNNKNNQNSSTNKKNSKSNMLMEIIDENLNSLNTNTLESNPDDKIPNCDYTNKFNFEFTDRTNPYFLQTNRENLGSNTKKFLNENKNTSFCGSDNLMNYDLQNTISEIDYSPFNLNENHNYSVLKDYKQKNDSDIRNINILNNQPGEKLEKINENNPRVNKTPVIITNENDENKSINNEKISSNLDYENYIKNNFRNSNTFDSQQIKDLKEIELKAKLYGTLNLNSENKNNPSVTLNFNTSENNNNNYNPDYCKSEYNDEDNNEQNNFSLNKNNYINASNVNKNKNCSIYTPNDSRSNPNSNSYSFTRNQTPNFFYSKGKIPLSNYNQQLSLQKIDSKESFTTDLNENVPYIQINRSNQIFQNNLNKDIENTFSNKFNHKTNNNKQKTDNLLISSKTKPNPNDFPFNYIPHSNFNILNKNKDTESMNKEKRLKDNESKIKLNDTKNFILNYDDYKLITLKPNEYVDTFENKLDFTGVTFNSIKNKDKFIDNNIVNTNNNSEFGNTNENFSNLFENLENNNKPKKSIRENKNRLDFNFNYNIFENNNEKIKDIKIRLNNSNTYLNSNLEDKDNKRTNMANKNKQINLNDNVYNMPLQQKKNKNYAIDSSKINDLYLKDALIESNKKNRNIKNKNIISEYFNDSDRKPLAVFFFFKLLAIALCYSWLKPNSFSFFQIASYSS